MDEAGVPQSTVAIKCPDAMLGLCVTSTANDGAQHRVACSRTVWSSSPPLPFLLPTSPCFPPPLSPPPSESMAPETVGSRYSICFSAIVPFHLISFNVRVFFWGRLSTHENKWLAAPQFFRFICEALLPSRFPQLLLMSLMWSMLAHPSGCLDGIA